jgi:[ribosomal protein S18]-alanine N-acetyltransferase
LRAFDQDDWPVALTPLGGDLAYAMAEVHERCFPRPWSAGDLRSLAEAPHCFGVAACCGHILAGFIIIGAAADESEILTLAVDQPWRRRGIGRTLLSAAINAAAERGATAMLLEVGVSNRAAQALYVECGFASIGRRRKYYRGPNGPEDALVMKRCIAPHAV